MFLPAQVSRTFSFSAAHRLRGHHKCGSLHGHTFPVRIEMDGAHVCDSGSETHGNGMIVDFGDISAFFERHVFLCFDHATILQKGDPYLDAIRDQKDERQKLVITTLPPTSEVLAGTIHRLFTHYFENGLGWQFGDLVFDLKVTVGEGPRSQATVSRSDPEHDSLFAFEASGPGYFRSETWGRR